MRTPPYTGSKDKGGNLVAEPNPIDQDELRPGSYYWARRCGAQDAEVVQISDVFGQERQFWSVAVMGSDQHHSLSEFSFLIRLDEP